MLDGKVALITGAAGGIGAATAAVFARERANLVLVDLDEQGLARVAGAVGPSSDASGRRIVTVVADTSVGEQVESYFERTIDTFGRVDILFNNAGVEGRVLPVHEQSDDDFDRVVRINLRGVWLNLRHAAAAMVRGGGGSIVNTASVAGLRGLPGLAPYVATKHAVVGLTRTAAVDLAAANVRVNAVCPGPTDTRMMRSLEDQQGDHGMTASEAQDRYRASIPLGRYARASEVAEVVAFLASERASYITGAVVPADGGRTA